MEKSESRFFDGQKDSNFFNYIYPTCTWSKEHMDKDILERTLFSDVLTAGFWAFKNQDRTSPKIGFINIISREQIISLVSNDFQEDKSNKMSVIINYRLAKFQISGWEHFNSWLGLQNLLTNNKKLNIIYSSGFINICKIW